MESKKTYGLWEYDSSKFHGITSVLTVDLLVKYCVDETSTGLSVIYVGHNHIMFIWAH